MDDNDLDSRFDPEAAKKLRNLPIAVTLTRSQASPRSNVSAKEGNLVGNSGGGGAQVKSPAPVAAPKLLRSPITAGSGRAGPCNDELMSDSCEDADMIGVSRRKLTSPGLNFSEIDDSEETFEEDDSIDSSDLDSSPSSYGSPPKLIDHDGSTVRMPPPDPDMLQYMVEHHGMNAKLSAMALSATNNMSIEAAMEHCVRFVQAFEAEQAAAGATVEPNNPAEDFAVAVIVNNSLVMPQGQLYTEVARAYAR